MTKANFQPALKRVLAYEGGYSNHPSDPGGVTLEGVIQRVYDGYRVRKGKPQRALTSKMRNSAEWKAERDEIYRENYWDKIRGDELPAGVDLVVFDGAVNSGPSQSAKWLQRAVGVTADGNIGDATLAAVIEHEDHAQLITAICERRLSFLKQLKTWSTFGKGWTSRVTDVRKTGRDWADGVKKGAKATPAHKDGGDAKAVEGNLSTAPVPVGAGATATTAGTVLTGATDQIQDTATKLSPFADAIQTVKYIVFGLTVIAASFTLYCIYRDYKAARARAGKIA